MLCADGFNLCSLFFVAAMAWRTRTCTSDRVIKFTWSDLRPRPEKSRKIEGKKFTFYICFIFHVAKR